ncbi:hypothetical protein COCMIDRAFT_101718 [Bipolaris oryzae ATCC 44560]|uniref:Uncharacterized protein n=1 Tax=Bipolaris oryzae ATCC 44560 TaxID=930090 RepID=W6YUG2_COCMI|nr:uncharacterized protein COCMIDRAFT_101718 [Bipolaris oryzae ATCC 44560]EUC43107.1 hypothetical protein COCMIDRAFT_101718 [Bipolaris oryzae ATCC 44560]
MRPAGAFGISFENRRNLLDDTCRACKMTNILRSGTSSSLWGATWVIEQP